MVIRAIFLTLALLTALLAAPVHAEPGREHRFPAGSTDARSLGRGGTVIASHGGASSIMGNPATLRRYGQMMLGIDYINDEPTDSDSWSFSIVDTKASFRGGGLYMTDPEFAGFKDYLWGVALAQSLGSALIIGESFHSGVYADPLSARDEVLSAGDIGLILNLGSNFSLGYLARNLYSSDEDLLEPANAFGVLITLPWTIRLTADLEENPYPSLDLDEDIRAGLEFDPFGSFTARLGYQEISEVTGSTTYYTAGLSYRDSKGSLDGAVSYDPDREEIGRFIISLNITK